MAFTESQIKAVGVGMILFAIFGTVSFYVVSYMMPDSIGTWYNETAVMDTNTNIPSYITQLMDLVPLGIILGLMLIGIIGGLKVAGVF